MDILWILAGTVFFVGSGSLVAVLERLRGEE